MYFPIIQRRGGLASDCGVEEGGGQRPYPTTGQAEPHLNELPCHLMRHIHTFGEMMSSFIQTTSLIQAEGSLFVLTSDAAQGAGHDDEM